VYILEFHAAGSGEMGLHFLPDPLSPWWNRPASHPYLSTYGARI